MSEEKEEEQITPSQVREIENGIFNLVITLTQTLTKMGDEKPARRYVIQYLERIIDGLKLIDNPEGEQDD